MGMFSSPASASGFNWGDHHGALLLIEPKGVDNVDTAYGEKDAVRADITVIDDEPEVFGDTLIFPRVLITQTKPLIGQKVLGRLGQGQAKKGQQPPWRLDDVTADEQQLAEEYVNNRDKPAMAKPAQSSAAPF